MRKFKWKIDPLLLIVVGVGIVTLLLKCRIAYPIQWIGDTDEAAYIDMADNLIHGKGLSNDFIQYSYFLSRLKYSEITQPEAHYAPLYSLLITPFFLMLGKSAFAAKLPAMIIGSLFLPVSLYLLTERLSRSRVASLAAGLSAMFFPVIFSRSLLPDDDVPFVFLIVLSCFLIIEAQDSPKFFYPAGIFIGLTYYAKGTGLWLIPAYLVFCLISGGLGILRNRKMWICFAIIFFIMLPWFVRNTIHFRNPIFSTQQYAAGYIGYKGWEEGTYSLYWGEAMPSLLSKFRQAGIGKVWEKSLEHYGYYLSRALAHYMSIPAILGLLLFMASCLYLPLNRLLMKKRHEAGKTHRVSEFLKPWHNRDLHALWLVSFFLMTFLAVCWSPIDRLALPFVMMGMAIGWTTCHIAAKQIFARAEHSYIIVPCLIVLLMIPVVSLSAAGVYGDYREGGFPYGEDFQSWMETGTWIKENLPGSVTMFREPGQLHFYSEEKGVQIPLADLDKIIKVMKFYKVTYIIPHVNMRPTMRPLVEGKIPGLKLVYDQGLKIYEIQYDLLPPAFVDGPNP
ncbi:glycosyltransferase family 39 protein [Candidatus Poribacteria bacterium]